MTTYYLYVKTHNVTGLKYLGQTIRNPMTYKGSGVRWLTHIKKYGNDVKTEILIHTNSKDVLRVMGSYYSKKFDIVESLMWANLKSETGDGGGGFSSEVRKRMGEKSKGRKPMLGKSHSADTKKKISDANKGKKLSDEHKLKISLNNARKSGMAGKKHTDESKLKISAAGKGKESPLKGKSRSEETKNRISAGMIGREVSETTKEKLRTAGRNIGCETRMKRSNTLKGHKVSEETRQKISNTLKERNKLKDTILIT